MIFTAAELKKKSQKQVPTAIETFAIMLPLLVTCIRADPVSTFLSKQSRQRTTSKKKLVYQEK